MDESRLNLVVVNILLSYFPIFVKEETVMSTALEAYL